MPRKPKETESLEEIKRQAEVSISSAEEKQSPATSTVSHATPKGKAIKKPAKGSGSKRSPTQKKPMSEESGTSDLDVSGKSVRVEPEKTTSKDTRTEVKKRPQGLLDRYRNEIIPTMRQEFSYKNQMQVPRLVKVILNMGLGEALTNPKAMDAASADIESITGQKPVIRRAKKSVANFKVREGMPIGIAVTLRSHRMYDFVERLIHAVLPRVRDFRGVSNTAFDGSGNYSLGIKEQTVFPEIDYNKIDKIRGLQVNIVTTAKTDQEAFKLLELVGLPFSREN
jgi:large subunit ribosomal protein L5